MSPALATEINAVASGWDSVWLMSLAWPADTGAFGTQLLPIDRLELTETLCDSTLQGLARSCTKVRTHACTNGLVCMPALAHYVLASTM